MGESAGGVERNEILAHVLAKDSQQPQDEPLIASNINEQLQHMLSLIHI